MGKKEQYEQKTWDHMLSICQTLGLRLVDCEYTKEGSSHALSVYIDKEGGVTVDDCEKVSDLLNPILDEEDYIPEEYTLYVSSPGLGRPLRRPHDFEFALDREIEIRTYKAVDGKKEFTGTLKEWSPREVVIDDHGTERRIQRADMSLIRLAFDF